MWVYWNGLLVVVNPETWIGNHEEFMQGISGGVAGCRSSLSKKIFDREVGA